PQPADADAPQGADRLQPRGRQGVRGPARQGRLRAAADRDGEVGPDRAGGPGRVTPAKGRRTETRGGPGLRFGNRGRALPVFSPRHGPPRRRIFCAPFPFEPPWTGAPPDLPTQGRWIVAGEYENFMSEPRAVQFSLSPHLAFIT